MFQKVFTAIIAITILINIIILLGVLGVLPHSEFIQKYIWVFIILVCIEIPVLYFVVYTAYIVPIQKLNQGIAKFHTGLDEDLNFV